MERIKVLKVNKSFYLRIPSKYVELGNVNGRSVFNLEAAMPIRTLMLVYARTLK